MILDAFLRKLGLVKAIFTLFAHEFAKIREKYYFFNRKPITFRKNWDYFEKYLENFENTQKFFKILRKFQKYLVNFEKSGILHLSKIIFNWKNVPKKPGLC